MWLASFFGRWSQVGPCQIERATRRMTAYRAVPAQRTCKILRRRRGQDSPLTRGPPIYVLTATRLSDRVSGRKVRAVCPLQLERKFLTWGHLGITVQCHLKTAAIPTFLN